MSKFTVNGLPWAPRGNRVVDVTDCETSTDVIKKSKLDFTVTKCPIVAEMPWHGQSKEDIMVDHFIKDTNIYASVDGFYATYRNDWMFPLGLVKSKYEIVQNIDAFNFFDDAIGEGMAKWQTAGYFGNGERIFVTAKLPFTVDVSGGDAIDTYLVFTNSHDGTHGVDILFTPIRVICQNTLNAAIKTSDCHIRFRHTQSVHGKISEAAEILGITKAKAEYTKELYKSLTLVNMSDMEVMKFVASCHLTDEEYAKVLAYPNDSGFRRLFYRDFGLLEDTKISTRKANICVSTLEYYFDGIGQKQIAGTAWGAYNAITGFYSNVANLEGEKRIDSLLYGNASRITAKAMETLLQVA